MYVWISLNGDLHTRTAISASLSSSSHRPGIKTTPGWKLVSTRGVKGIVLERPFAVTNWPSGARIYVVLELSFVSSAKNSPLATAATAIIHQDSLRTDICTSSSGHYLHQIALRVQHKPPQCWWGNSFVDFFFLSSCLGSNYHDASAESSRVSFAKLGPWCADSGSRSAYCKQYATEGASSDILATIERISAVSCGDDQRHSWGAMWQTSAWGDGRQPHICRPYDTRLPPIFRFNTSREGCHVAQVQHLTSHSLHTFSRQCSHPILTVKCRLGCRWRSSLNQGSGQ